MKKILLFLFLTAKGLCFSQYASIELSQENAKILGEVSKKATLFVVINNEKDPKDAALVNAAKNYWKAGPYKFMSSKEFITIKNKNELSPTDLYLYEWFDGYYTITPGQADLSAFLKINTGLFFLSYGGSKPLTEGKSANNIVSLKFDLSSTLANSKDKVIDGYFDLMVKYFYNEVLFCQKQIIFKDVKKDSKDGIAYFDTGLNDVQSKDILLIKEQVNKSLPKNKKGAKKASPMSVVSMFNPPVKNVYTVFPEDIKMAVNKNDKQVLLYTNDMLISAQDGKVVAAQDKFGFAPAKKDYTFWLVAFGILISAFTTATIMK